MSREHFSGVRGERGEPGVATCLVKHDKQRVKMARRWLDSWVSENTL